MQISEIHKIYLRHPHIVIDSRKAIKDCLFFALKGENFDGNDFAHTALQNGAAYVVVDNADVVRSDKYILVENVLRTLQSLANFHRKQLKFPVLAITGSNGKTTTKELVREVLNKKYNVKATSGNYNNHIGVPLTILSADFLNDFLIVEMGANHQGEIDELCKIAEPDFVMITNIGKAHMEGFGGIEGIKKGKSEMYRYAQNYNKIIFINTNDLVLCGLIPENSYTEAYSVLSIVENLSTEPTLAFDYNSSRIITQLYGEYNLPNIVFAIVAGEYFKVREVDIASAISNYIPENNRSQIISLGTKTIIKDAYNANPTSMKLSIQSFGKLDADKKIIILGDMLELGEYSDEEHAEIINLVNSLNFYKAIFIGNHFLKSGQNMKGNFFNDLSEAKSYFQLIDSENAHILLKGSRGIAVEKLLFNG